MSRKQNIKRATNEQNAPSVGLCNSLSCQFSYGALGMKPTPLVLLCRKGTPFSPQSRKDQPLTHTQYNPCTYASHTVGSLSRTVTEVLIYPVFLALSLVSSILEAINKWGIENTINFIPLLPVLYTHIHLSEHKNTTQLKCHFFLTVICNVA